MHSDPCRGGPFNKLVFQTESALDVCWGKAESEAKAKIEKEPDDLAYRRLLDRETHNLPAEYSSPSLETKVHGNKFPAFALPSFQNTCVEGHNHRLLFPKYCPQISPLFFLHSSFSN